MSCAKYRHRVSALGAGELPRRLEDEVRAHLATCAACARLHDETRATLSLLRGLGEEPLPEDFSRSLHRRLVTSPPPERPGRVAAAWAFLVDLVSARPVASGLVSAAAAAAIVVAVGVGGGHRLPGLSGGGHGAVVAAGDVPPIFVVPRAKVAVVRIDFNVEESVDDVEFAIRLPDGLHFVSEGRELPDREFRWRGRLERGSNQIPVAVRGRRAGRYTLSAHAVGAEVRAQHDVVLEVTS